ncbi:hypothetical protein [Streptomyces anulatus]|uniref:hypothetical protein n=1 Tax=Streptomyces anulatus TaxID=1892 RepID=UPI003413C3D0
MSTSKRDALTAAVELLGALPMPVGAGTVPMRPEQRKALAVQIGDVQPATDALIGSFAESVANVRNHEHPSWEDLYCMNLTSYMGERMAPVLKRLLDTETENARLRARVAELEARHAAVLSLHRKHSDSEHCFADDETWPCNTRTALGQAEAPCRPCGCPKRFDRHAEGCHTECPSCAAPADVTGYRIPQHRDGCPQAVTS